MLEEDFGPILSRSFRHLLPENMSPPSPNHQTWILEVINMVFKNDRFSKGRQKHQQTIEDLFSSHLLLRQGDGQGRPCLRHRNSSAVRFGIRCYFENPSTLMIECTFLIFSSKTFGETWPSHLFQSHSEVPTSSSHGSEMGAPQH